jgi:hypothetical protein
VRGTARVRIAGDDRAGSPEGPVEAQWVHANEEVFKLDQDQLAIDFAAGATRATIQQDARTLEADADALAAAIKAFAEDLGADAGVFVSGDRPDRFPFVLSG